MKRSVTYGMSMAVYTVIVIGVVVLINVFGARRHAIVDMTDEGAFTLSPQTEKILDALEEAVTVKAFVRPDRNSEVADLLDMYAYHSEKFTYEIVDPDKSPAIWRDYNVTDYGTLVVETASGRRESAQKLDEQSVTLAILKAATSTQKKLYILTGHNERSLGDDKPLGWSGAKKALESVMYNVQTLNWFTTGAIPNDVDLLIIPGPRTDFQSAEIARLSEYLANGGKLLVTLDPVTLPNIQKLLGDYGFGFFDDMILDPLSEQLGFDPLVATIASYPDHPVVKEMKTATFFPVARSLGLRFSNPKKANVKPIGMTTAQSWSETDLDSIDKRSPVFSKSDDLAGPRVILASAEWETGPPKEKKRIGETSLKTRMVVAGDSDFASNATMGLSGNRDLFLNITAWLLEDEKRISIRPKSRGFHPILFTNRQLLFIFWTVVVAAPAAVVLAGVGVFLRRRRQ